MSVGSPVVKSKVDWHFQSIFAERTETVFVSVILGKGDGWFPDGGWWVLCWEGWVDADLVYGKEASVGCSFPDREKITVERIQHKSMIFRWTLPKLRSSTCYFETFKEVSQVQTLGVSLKATPLRPHWNDRA